MESLLDYMLRITPGLVLITALFMLVPRKLLILRIMLLILGFILMRDAMTPVGYWNFGLTDWAVWLRFIDDGWLLVTLGVLSLVTSVVLLQSKDLRKLVQWGDVRSPQPYIVGILAGIAVALPFVLLAQTVDMADRGGVVAVAIIPAVLFMALAGNFLEELLFRGFLQSYVAKYTDDIRAAVISGVMFAVAHIFLASTVTDLGWPLLVFVLIEGLACAFVYRRYGLISAALVHGVAIFVLASGLV